MPWAAWESCQHCKCLNLKLGSFGGEQVVLSHIPVACSPLSWKGKMSAWIKM